MSVNIFFFIDRERVSFDYGRLGVDKIIEPYFLSTFEIDKARLFFPSR
jgi:hypothetical protein